MSTWGAGAWWYPEIDACSAGRSTCCTAQLGYSRRAAPWGGGGAATVYLAKLRAPPAQVLASLTAGDVLEKEEYGRCAGEEMSEQSTEQREEEWG